MNRAVVGASPENAMPGLHPRRLPHGASDAEIDAAVAEAGLLPLLMSVVHLTGSLDILDEAGETQKPQFSTDMSGGIAPELAATLRQHAARAIRAWRDAGFPAPHDPTEAQLARMIDTLAGKALDPRYRPLLTEELGFPGDERAVDWSGIDEAAKSRLPVLVVGAGLSGLVMGYRLKQAGVPFTIVEKNDGPGGTWFENRYPGARVDVPSHCYSFSFTRDFPWPEMFSPWPVLRRYFAQMAEQFGLQDVIRYGVEVTRAVWDENAREWAVTLRADGKEETQRVRVLVSAVGQLNRPLIPEIANQDAFTGQRFHTSRWPEGTEVAGKKVIVIGTAATALQLIPELANQGADVTVFQRSPTWVLVHPEYRKAITPAQQWAIDHLPGYARWYRLILYNWAADGDPAHMTIDPAWPQDGKSVSAANLASRERLTKGMAAMIGDDPELLAKLIPDYPPYVKRPNLGDGGYFAAFRKPNVKLVTQGAARFTPTGLVDGAGVEHPADIVVYATGFRALEYLAPMEIVGRGGQRIDQFWGDEPRAHLGITVPNFPNLYLLYGPGTNLGYNGNLFFNAECQVRYTMNALHWMAQDGLDALEVKREVYDDYARRMDAALANYTWSHGGAGSWYKNKAGKVIANSPWPLVQYWEWTREPDHAEFATTPAQTAASTA